MEAMQLEKHMQDDVTVITLDGNLDSNTAPRIQQELIELTPERSPLLLDLSRLAYMSSAGLRVLLLVYRHAEQSGSRLALACVPEDAYEVMSATGFLDFFTVAPSVHEGVAALSA
jgi:anti-sigma B factor antagonist